MVADHTTTAGPNLLLTPAEMADWLGVTIAEIRDLADAGHLVRAERNFALKASVQVYIAHLLNLAADELSAYVAEEAEMREASRKSAAVVRSAMHELHPDRDRDNG